MITLTAPSNISKCFIQLSGSKSISNRFLILNQVFHSNLSFSNISDSEDTQLLQKAFQKIKNKTREIINVHHAGSDMRFLTALLSVTEGEWTLTGSDRMKERPIGELVEALKSLGAEITYLENENFPPLLIQGKKLKGGRIEIDSSVSSQFISALLLIAPTLEIGLEIKLKGKTVSRPYIDMTTEILKNFGIKLDVSENAIHVYKSQIADYKFTIAVESDWSSASYWYSICSLAANAQIELSFLHKTSWQADSILPDLYKDLGVKTTFKLNSIVLTSIKPKLNEFLYDFTNCPDIAQTIAVTCVGLGIKASLTGLQTLKVKETDRLVALKTELEKFGAEIRITKDSLQIKSYSLKPKRLTHTVSTYNDHRMAMSFAPLALVHENLKIDDPSVVTKSYPSFWEDLKSVGFSVNLQP